MPKLVLTTEVDQLKKYYNTLGWFSRFFFPSQLKQALTDNASPLIVFQAAFDSSLFFHRWFFSGLRAFFQSDDVRSTQWLCERNAKRHETLHTILALPDPEAITAALCTLNKANAFDTQLAMDNFNRFQNQFDRAAMARTLILLNERNLLSSNHAQSIFKALSDYQMIPGNLPVYNAVALLDQLGILSTDRAHSHLLALLTHPASNWVERNLFLLNQVGVLNAERAQAYFNAVITHPNPADLHRILSLLSQTGLLNSERAHVHVEGVISHTNAPTLYRALNSLHQLINLERVFDDRLDQAHAYLREVLEAPDPEIMAHSILGPFNPNQRRNAGSLNQDAELNLEHLADIAANRESSMRGLSPSEQQRLDGAVHHYQPQIDALGGVEPCFQALLRALELRYQQNPARINMNTGYFSSTQQEQILPLSRDDFDRLNFYDLSGATRTRALTAYYQNKDHTARRYLSSPNSWRANGTNAASFEYHKTHIVMLWLAASDRDLNMAPTESSGHTVATRIDHFIAELALIGRAHNWDNTRAKTNARGRVIREEYDDLRGDKPSCHLGIRSRLFQAVQGHPLLAEPLRTIIKQELREFVWAHFRRHITLENREALQSAWNELTDTGQLSEPHRQQLDTLNIPLSLQTNFLQHLTQKYPSFQTADDLRELVTGSFAFNQNFASHAARFGGPDLVDLNQLLEAPSAPSVKQNNPIRTSSRRASVSTLFIQRQTELPTEVDSASQNQDPTHGFGLALTRT